MGTWGSLLGSSMESFQSEWYLGCIIKINKSKLKKGREEQNITVNQNPFHLCSFACVTLDKLLPTCLELFLHLWNGNKLPHGVAGRTKWEMNMSQSAYCLVQSKGDHFVFENYDIKKWRTITCWGNTARVPKLDLSREKGHKPLWVQIGRLVGDPCQHALNTHRPPRSELINPGTVTLSLHPRGQPWT